VYPRIGRNLFKSCRFGTNDPTGISFQNNSGPECQYSEARFVLTQQSQKSRTKKHSVDMQLLSRVFFKSKQILGLSNALHSDCKTGNKGFPNRELMSWVVV